MQQLVNKEMNYMYPIQQETLGEFLLVDLILSGTIPVQTVQQWCNMISQHLNSMNMEQTNSRSFIKIKKSISKTQNSKDFNHIEHIEKTQVDEKANDDDNSNTCEANNCNSEHEIMHKEAELEICHQSSITKESSASQAQVKVDDDNFDESIFPLEQTLPDDKSDFKKNNLINFDVLKDHKYEIVPNTKSKKSENNYLYICKYDNCNKSFSKTWNLVYHFRVHTNEKPFECNHCGKKFSQKGNLGRHLETHEVGDISNRKTFSCKICKSTYTNVYNLKNHMKKKNHY